MHLPDDPKLSKLLEDSVQAAEHGAALTRRMLAFARRRDLNVEFVQLSASRMLKEALDGLIRLLRLRLRRRRVAPSSP